MEGTAAGSMRIGSAAVLLPGLEKNSDRFKFFTILTRRNIKFSAEYTSEIAGTVEAAFFGDGGNRTVGFDQKRSCSTKSIVGQIIYRGLIYYRLKTSEAFTFADICRITDIGNRDVLCIVFMNKGKHAPETCFTYLSGGRCAGALFSAGKQG